MPGIAIPAEMTFWQPSGVQALHDFRAHARTHIFKDIVTLSSSDWDSEPALTNAVPVTIV